MLQIRLRKPSSEIVVGAVVKPLPADAVTVACPDHLVLADLPVAKGIGSAPSAVTVKNVGRRSRRLLGERVHFCVRCDFPIAIYGRLSPCEHAFCLDCARSDTICYLCDERIQKIQTIKLMEGIFICAAPHCLKSFLKRSEFEIHIQENHANLLHPNAEKEDGNESEVQSAKQSTTSGSSIRPPPRPVISPGSNSQLHQPREQPLQRPMMQPNPSFYGQPQNYMSESHTDSNRPQVFDRHSLQNHFHQGIPGAPQQDSGQFSDKQQGILSEANMSEYPPVHAIQPQPNFIVPMNSNPLSTPPFGMPPPFQPEGGQRFFGAPYDMGQTPRPDSAQEMRAEQGSMLNFPPGGGNFANYHQHWNAGQSPVGQGTGDGFANGPDAQGNVAFYQGDYGRNASVPPMPPPPSSMNKGMEGMLNASAVDPRDSRGVLVQQPYQHPPQPLVPMPHSSHAKRGKYYSGDMGHDGQGFGWQHENRDGFGSGQD